MIWVTAEDQRHTPYPYSKRGEGDGKGLIALAMPPKSCKIMAEAHGYNGWQNSSFSRHDAEKISSLTFNN